MSDGARDRDTDRLLDRAVDRTGGNRPPFWRNTVNTLRNLALASTFGMLMVGPVSAMSTWPQATSGTTASETFDDGEWTADATGMVDGRSVHHDDHHPMHHYNTLHHSKRHHYVHANGFCNGRSHGTGDRSCGTATGGPVGGNASRN